MQGYTNGVSIFQRDFAVKQDYPEIIKPEIIKVLSKKQRYGWLPRQRDRNEAVGVLEYSRSRAEQVSW